MSIQSIEAEQSVLGSILLEDDLVKECRLTEEHFTSAVHQAIFRMMKQMEEEGGPVDLVTLSEKMGPSFLEQIGGISFLVSMIESVPTTVNFFHYEKIVRSAWKMRNAANIAQHMHELLHSAKDEKIIGLGITKLSELEEDGCMEEVEFSDAITQVFESFQEDIGELSGIDTGFSSLNKLTYGLQEGDFVVLGARPSMGKTAFALNIALHAAKSGAAVGLFSLEMSREQLLKRMISCEGQIEGEKLKNPKQQFDREDWNKAVRVCGELSNLPFTIFDKAGIHIQEIFLQVRKLKRKSKGKKHLIIIDYLQLITGDEKHRGNRLQEMSEISRKLKQSAREQNVCVLALSQLSRGIESRNDKRPILSDLRETGQIEQDADVIMLMYREENYEKDTVNKDVTEIHVAKHRNGPVGNVKLRFLKEYGKFVGGERGSTAEGNDIE